MASPALMYHSSYTGLLREMLGYMAQDLIELEAENVIGATYGKRRDERVNQQNVYPGRTKGIRDRTIELRVPNLRQGVCSAPQLTGRRSSSHAG